MSEFGWQNVAYNYKDLVYAWKWLIFSNIIFKGFDVFKHVDRVFFLNKLFNLTLQGLQLNNSLVNTCREKSNNWWHCLCKIVVVGRDSLYYSKVVCKDEF